jgi:hypothetical protein
MSKPPGSRRRNGTDIKSVTRPLVASSTDLFYAITHVLSPRYVPSDERTGLSFAESKSLSIFTLRIIYNLQGAMKKTVTQGTEDWAKK